MQTQWTIEVVQAQYTIEGVDIAIESVKENQNTIESVQEKHNIELHGVIEIKIEPLQGVIENKSLNTIKLKLTRTVLLQKKKIDGARSIRYRNGL